MSTDKNTFQSWKFKRKNKKPEIREGLDVEIFHVKTEGTSVSMQPMQ